MSKKKILLLSDDMRMSSGIATMSKALVMGTLNEYDWFQVGAAIKHPDKGKVLDLSVDMQKRKRSDIIKSINMKYQLIDPNKILIERVKSELDARLQEYYLTTDTLDFLNDMNNQTQE